jgi:hypothetical protein
VHQSAGLAKRIQERVVEARGQQDNELWHLLILQDLIAREDARESQLNFFWLPQIIAFGYEHLTARGVASARPPLVRATAYRSRGSDGCDKAAGPVGPTDG